MVMMIDHESREIADANRKLASRTQRQSTSLVETAASMEQMSSIVYSNANDAKNASTWFAPPVKRLIPVAMNCRKP